MSTIVKKRRREKKKKKGEKGRPWLWRVGPKQGQGLCGGWGLCLVPTGLEKALGLWGVGLRFKKQKAPRHAPHPWSQRTGDLTWEPSRLPGFDWAGQTPSSPLLLLQCGRAPPTCLS